MTHILYLLVRTDMASMNAGKGMAQASHASNAFVNEMSRQKGDNHRDFEAFSEWEQATPQGFGTVLVLGVNEAQMNTAAMIMDDLGYVSNVVHDPTYPLVDGETVHFLPIDTCAYVFVPNKEDDVTAAAVLGNFDLHL